MGEVLSFGFNLAVSTPNDKAGVARHVFVFLPTRVKRWGFHHIARVYPSTQALLRSYELNTLDACWIAVDVWTNSTRC